MKPGEKRYIGLDIHRHYVMVGGVNDQQAVVLTPRRVGVQEFGAWAAKHLGQQDSVVMEATTNVWPFYDLLEPIVGQAKVAHAYHIKLIGSALVKTDKRDTLTLAKLLAAKLIPEVWVPPQPVRELRSLIRQRQHLLKQRTMAKNRLQGVLFRHNLQPPQGNPFTLSNRPWWEQLPLNAVERLRVSQDLDSVDYFTKQIEQLEAQLAHLSVSTPWIHQVPYLLQVPGIGLVSAMTILSAIGDITRFAHPKKLVGYAGLGARVHASGQTKHGGTITKQGRTELRTILIEVAWVAVRCSPFWRQRFQALAARKGKQKAVTILARHLLVLIWHVLSKAQVDRHADPGRTARTFLKWAYTHQLASSQGLTGQAFVQRALRQLGCEPLPAA
jgi:transposase